MKTDDLMVIVLSNRAGEAKRLNACIEALNAGNLKLLEVKDGTMFKRIYKHPIPLHPSVAFGR